MEHNGTEYSVVQTASPTGWRLSVYFAGRKPKTSMSDNRVRPGDMGNRSYLRQRPDPEPGGRPPVIRNFVACLTHMVDAAARTPCDKNRVHVVFKQGKGCHAVTERAIDLENRNYFIVMKQLPNVENTHDIDATPRSEVVASFFDPI
jgi:hypothetical protein